VYCWIAFRVTLLVGQRPAEREAQVDVGGIQPDAFSYSGIASAPMPRLR
jgi:hypothetical protein